MSHRIAERCTGLIAVQAPKGSLAAFFKEAQDLTSSGAPPEAVAASGQLQPNLLAFTKKKKVSCRTSTLQPLHLSSLHPSCPALPIGRCCTTLPTGRCCTALPTFV